MNQQASTPQKQPINTVNLITPAKKSDAQMRKQKKKKSAAFATFLNKIQSPAIQSPSRQLSGQKIILEKLTFTQICKICGIQNPQRRHTCQFCKDVVCVHHCHKKRRNPETNKFSRICEYCEDDYLYRKHLQNQMKTEESITTQEIILQGKKTELSQLLQSKRLKIRLLMNKRQQLQQKKSKEITRLAGIQSDNARRQKQVQRTGLTNQELQKSIVQLQKRMPASLAADYQFLQGENERITKDLVKLQKMCNDVVMARSVKEKQMYEEYYAWQSEQKKNLEETDNKKQQCLIY